MKALKNITEIVKFKTESEKIEFLTDTIQLDFLHQILENSESSQTDIAKKLKVSDSFVSQLFSVDKRLSLNHIASIIYHLNLHLKLEITPRENNEAKIVRLPCEEFIPQSKLKYNLPGKKEIYQLDKPEKEGPELKEKVSV